MARLKMGSRGNLNRTIVAKKEEIAEKKAADEKPKETTVEFLASLAAVLVTGLFIITFVV